MAILDVTGLTGALAAYSVSQVLRDAYSGSLIRVRRSSDSTEQDIGSSGGLLDVASLLSFCGAGNGFITTVYDQSGNSHNLVQTTVANQPQIVTSGALTTDIRSFLCSAIHDGTDDLLRTASNVSFSSYSALTGILWAAGPFAAAKSTFYTGTNAATQINAFFANTDALATTEQIGMSSGAGAYNLWRRLGSGTNRITRGAILDRTLAAGSEVIPVRAGVASQTGYTQPFTTNMTGSFTDQVLSVGSTACAMAWQHAILWPSALSTANAELACTTLGSGMDGVCIGDSTVTTFSSQDYVANLLYTSAEKCSQRGVTNLAVAGDTIAQQKTAWTNFVDKTVPRWVIVQVGLNDMDPATATATTIAAYQDLIDTIRSGVSTSCKIIVATMTPAYERWAIVGYNSANAQAKWVALNDAIMNRGGSPITGVDGRIEQHTIDLTTLVSGNAALNPTYDVGDKIHPTTAGRQLIANSWRAGLRALGFFGGSGGAASLLLMGVG